MTKNWNEFIGELLEENEFNYSQFSNKRAYTLTFEGENTDLDFLVFTPNKPITEETMLLIAGKLPYSIPDEDKSQFLEFINKRNQLTFIGHFELTSKGNKISFKLGSEIWPDFNAKKLKSLIFLAATELDDFEEEIRKEANSENPRFKYL